MYFQISLICGSFLLGSLWCVAALRRNERLPAAWRGVAASDDDRRAAAYQQVHTYLKMSAVVFLIPIAFVAVAVAVATVLYLRSARRQPRRMSVFSEILAHPSGSFPPSTKLPPTSVHATIFLDELPEMHELAKIWREKVLIHDRFASRITTDPVSDKLTFERVTGVIDIERDHVHEATVGSDVELMKYIESILDRSWIEEQALGKPLWYIHIITNTGASVPDDNADVKPGQSDPRRQSAIVFEFNHAIADGMSLMLLLQTLYTDKDGKPIRFEGAKVGADHNHATTKSLHNPKRSHESKSLMQHLKTAVQMAQTSVLVARAVVKILLGANMWPDSPTCIKEPISPFVADRTRRIYTLPPISLAAIKAIKTKLHCSVNDVMTSALAGAVRRYLVYRADRYVAEPDAANHLQIRSLVPYAFPRKPSKDSNDILHNDWILVSIPLAVGAASATDRVAQTKAIIDTVKFSGEGFVARALQAVSYHVMGFQQTVQISFDYFIRHSLIFTNVPGFLQPIYLCNKPVARVQPIVSNALPQFSVVSFCDGLYMNYVVNPNRIVEAQRIGEFYVRELQAMVDEIGVTEQILL